MLPLDVRRGETTRNRSAASKNMNNRDDATTACTYFLHLCESIDVEVDEGLIRIASPVTTRDGMDAVLRTLIVPELAPNARLHAAFFASDYQLARLERIGAVVAASLMPRRASQSFPRSRRGSRSSRL